MEGDVHKDQGKPYRMNISSGHRAEGQYPTKGHSMCKIRKTPKETRAWSRTFSKSLAYRNTSTLVTHLLWAFIWRTIKNSHTQNIKLHCFPFTNHSRCIHFRAGWGAIPGTPCITWVHPAHLLGKQLHTSWAELLFQQCKGQFSSSGLVQELGWCSQRSSTTFWTAHFSEGGSSLGTKNDTARLSSRVRGGWTSLYVISVVTVNPKGYSLVRTSLRVPWFASGSFSFSRE